jgi:hypothetical protein
VYYSLGCHQRESEDDNNVSGLVRIGYGRMRSRSCCKVVQFEDQPTESKYAVSRVPL